MLLHYIEKLKIKISADIQHTWKKMQTQTDTEEYLSPVISHGQ